MMKELLANLKLGKLLKKGKINMKKIRYTFKKEHQIVKSWVALVNGGTYQLEDVPALSNLREVVAEVLTEQASVKEETIESAVDEAVNSVDGE